jgi:hypothetical protein
LDDYFFVDSDVQTSLANGKVFDSICTDIGIPQAPDKKTFPSHETEFLGILLDSRRWIASLPISKVIIYASHIQNLITLRKTTQTNLQSVIGKLSFATSAVPARPFLRRLIDKIHTVRRPYHYIKITNDMVCDLQTWLYFLANYNGITYFRSLKILPDTHLNMLSDASKQGYGATFGSHWIQERYPQHWQQLFDDKKIGITTLELYPVLAIVTMFAHRIKNSHILFHSDNEGVVYIINKQSSRNKIIMNIIRPLVLVLMNNNIMLRSKHIPGKNNILCDAISRFKQTPTILQSYGMDPAPTPIPPQLLSANFALR